MRVFERQNDCVITFHLHKSLILGRPDPLLFMREGVATPGKPGVSGLFLLGLKMRRHNGLRRCPMRGNSLYAARRMRCWPCPCTLGTKLTHILPSMVAIILYFLLQPTP